MALWRMSCLCGSRWNEERSMVFSKGTRCNAPNRHTVCGEKKNQLHKKRQEERKKKQPSSCKRRREKEMRREPFGEGGGGSEEVTAVIDKSRDRRMSHPCTFTAQERSHTLPVSCVVISPPALQPIRRKSLWGRKKICFGFKPSGQQITPTP